MTNKTLSERIAEIIDEGNACEDSDISYLLNKMALICEELQAENKSWQEMVDSVNQTNRAMGNMLKKLDDALAKVEIVNIALRQIKNLNPELPDDIRAFDNGYSVFEIAEAALDKINKQGVENEND